MLLIFLGSLAIVILSYSSSILLPSFYPALHNVAFSDVANHCNNIPPILHETFVYRQNALAQELYALNASAYIAEPGANAAYFANISSSHWHISERPLLLFVQPYVPKQTTPYPTHQEVQANVSVLTPYFEATRAKLLPIPSSLQVTYPEWKEHENPYKAVISAIKHVENGTIFVDDAIRHFIVDGLQQASPSTKVVSAPVQIRRLRERKNKEELDILKCANEVTQPCLFLRTRQSNLTLMNL